MATPTGPADPLLADPLLADEVSARFVEIVYADEELLAAEFEAIIAASWAPPTTPPRGEGAGDAPSESPLGSPQPGPRSRWVSSRPPRRERSPPRPRPTNVFRDRRG